MDILQMTVSAAALIAVVAALRLTAGCRWTKTTFVVLWKIALLRLLLPVSIPSGYSGYSVFGSVSDGLVMKGAEIVQASSASLWLEAAAVVWAAGAGVLALYFSVLLYRSWKEIGAALPVKGNALIEAWQRKQNTWRRVRVLVSDRIATPVTYGIIKPRIVLPKSMDFGNEAQLRYILAHELVHIKRFDALWKLLSVAALCLHWVNPLVWLLYMFLNRDMEMSCDEKVIRRLGDRAKSGYVRSIIAMAELKMRFTPFFSGFGKHVTEERIVSIMRGKKTTFAGFAAACLCAALSLTVFVGSGPAVSKAAAENEAKLLHPFGKQIIRIYRWEVIDGSRTEMKMYIEVDGALRGFPGSSV